MNGQTPPRAAYEEALYEAIMNAAARHECDPVGFEQWRGRFYARLMAAYRSRGPALASLVRNAILLVEGLYQPPRHAGVELGALSRHARQAVLHDLRALVE